MLPTIILGGKNNATKNQTATAFTKATAMAVPAALLRLAFRAAASRPLATNSTAEAEPPETGSPEEMLQTSPPPNLILDGDFETYTPNTNIKNLTDDNKWYSVTENGATWPSATVSSEQSYSGSQSTAVNVALNFEKQMNMNFYRYAYCPTAVTPSPNATSIAYDTVFQNISQRLTNTLPPPSFALYVLEKGYYGDDVECDMAEFNEVQ